MVNCIRSQTDAGTHTSPTDGWPCESRQVFNWDLSVKNNSSNMPSHAGTGWAAGAENARKKILQIIAALEGHQISAHDRKVIPS
jgi:hypothetical protein